MYVRAHACVRPIWAYTIIMGHISCTFHDLVLPTIGAHDAGVSILNCGSLSMVYIEIGPMHRGRLHGRGGVQIDINV